VSGAQHVQDGERRDRSSWGENPVRRLRRVAWTAVLLGGVAGRPSAARPRGAA
jgi:hypothetical protein